MRETEGRGFLSVKRKAPYERRKGTKVGKCLRRWEKKGRMKAANKNREKKISTIRSKAV